MLGGSGLDRELLHHARELRDTFVRDETSSDSGVREEDLREMFVADARMQGMNDEQAARAFFAFRHSVVQPEERSIPIAERSPGLGHVVLGDPGLTL